MISSAFSKKIYNRIKGLPIIDYHCHLSPKEIYEDKPFECLAKMWLECDHYKWRLMRAFGVSEELITGNADFSLKFKAFTEAVHNAFGNPLKDWAELELLQFFGIKLPLLPKNADKILNLANTYIEKEGLSPRKILNKCKVEFVATTDDPCDSLEYHKLIKEDKNFRTRVTPSFRADRLFAPVPQDFLPYLKRLEEVTEKSIKSLEGFLGAVENRMAFFKECGCVFSDLGIAHFPLAVGSRDKASEAFKAILAGKADSTDYSNFRDYMYIFWLEKSKEFGFTAQWHINVVRNTNAVLFKNVGTDLGCDTVGVGFNLNGINCVLNYLNSNNGIPNTIIYSLNPTDYYPLISLIGSFREVRLGIAWWFNDHKRGIENYLESVSELSHISAVPGMLTDSRSFLSYSRHIYFRKILADFLSRYKKENKKVIYDTARQLSYYGMKGELKL
ncbi:MAG: glucuronate isomerase [Firmicutes bacterium]|nr:glucuronate isomerase [Bacillota bacterium]